MDTNRNSVESQLRTRCNILESQIETLEKHKTKSSEKFAANCDSQAEPWKEVAGIEVSKKSRTRYFRFRLTSPLLYKPIPSLLIE